MRDRSQAGSDQKPEPDREASLIPGVDLPPVCGIKAWDDATLEANVQADRYCCALANDDVYVWPRDLSDEQILERMVALDRARVTEEEQGEIRWLRPEFQKASCWTLS